MIDFVGRWSRETEIAVRALALWLGLRASKFYSWRARYGRVNEHNAWVPRDFWLEAWEKRAMLEFHDRYPLEGYRRQRRAEGIIHRRVRRGRREVIPISTPPKGR